MSDRQFQTAVQAWLEDGSDRTPLPAIQAVLLAVKTTPQQRDLRIPWRFNAMNNTMRLASAAIVAVVAVGGALYLLRPSGGFGGESTRPTASPAAATVAPSGNPTIAPTLGPTAGPPSIGAPVAFTSPLYGYTVSRPDDWVVTAATTPWPAGSTCCLGQYADSFEAPRSMFPAFDGVLVATQPVPDGMTQEDWLFRHAQQQAASGRDCKGAPDAWTDGVVGTLPVRRVDLTCQGIHLSDVAFVVDGRGFMMSGNSDVIAQFLSTFSPEE